MKRLSPHLGSDSLEIKNTGLRPNWGSFWALETSGSELGQTQSGPSDSVFSCKSGQSGVTGSGIRHVRLVTGSEWIGEWDRTGMSGMGIYKMPHGVLYEGTMKAGLFEGVGVLRYPNGSILEGLWYQGKLKYWQYDYADGLERDCQSWTYCTTPDRRFFSEHVVGFRPANAEQLTNDHPAREVPPGHYDVGLGFFNPKSHCVVDAITGEVLSIPTTAEEKWILEHCRSAEPTESVGYCPELYENWLKQSQDQQQTSTEIRPEECENECRPEPSVKYENLNYIKEVEAHNQQQNESENLEMEPENHFLEAEKAILQILQQEGGKLHPVNTPDASTRKSTLHEKLESEQGQEQFRAASFELLLKKLLKEVEFRQTVKTSIDSTGKTDTVGNENTLFRLTQIISAFAENSVIKKNASSSLGSAFEQLRMTGKFIPFASPPSKNVSCSTVSYRLNDLEFLDDESSSEHTMSKNSKSEESIIHSTTYDTS